MTLFFLPGKEDNILTSGRKLGITGTVALWFAFVLVSAFMPGFKKKAEYKTVRITLASVPVERTVEPAVQEPVPQTTVNEPVQAKPAEPENVPAPAKKAEPAGKPEPQKKVEPPKKAAPVQKQKPAQTSAAEPKKTSPANPAQTYKKSVDELMAEQNAQKEKDVQWDDSVSENAVETSNAAAPSTPQAKQITGDAALLGKSAEMAQHNNGPVNSTPDEKNKNGGSADESTKSALGTISSTTYTQSAGSGASSQPSGNTGRNKDGVVNTEIFDIRISDGRTRLPPMTSIQFSKDNEQQIGNSCDVEVRFKVLANGSVLLSDITIKPASILPPAVRQEIREQVSQWRFTPGSSDGDAVFTLTIIKK